MKTKTDAAKVLLENGWTFEEVEKALGKDKVTAPVIIREPIPWTIPPVEPYTWPSTRPWPWRLQETWCCNGTTTDNKLTFSTRTESN